MNNDWKVVKIPKVLSFQEGPGVRKHQFTSEGVKLLNVGNINNGQINLSKTKIFISEQEAYGKYKHFLVDEGDLVIASSGIIVSNFHNKIAFITKEHLPLCMNTSTIRFKAIDEKVIDINYFKYFLKTSFFSDQLQRLITGSAQLNFGPSHLQQIDLLLPPIVKQREIIELLDQADVLRQKRKQATDLLDEYLKSVFLDMFGDPEENHKQWPKLELKAVVDIQSGQVSPKIEPYASMIHIGGADIQSGTGKIIRKIPARNAGQISGKYLFDEQYLLYSKIRPNLNKVSLPDFKGICSADIYPIKPKENLNKYFLAFILKSDGFLSYAIKNSGRANIPKINRFDLSKYTIIVPPVKIQGIFENKWKQVESLKQLLLAQSTELEDQFQALMQKSFRQDA